MKKFILICTTLVEMITIILAGCLGVVALYYGYAKIVLVCTFILLVIAICEIIKL